MPFQPSAHNGTVHHFSPGLVAFEHKPNTSTVPHPNVLIWVGGLGDGLLTVPYPTTLAARLPPTWTLAQPILTSSYAGWGTGSLARDADELHRLVAYFRALRPAGAAVKVVLMGHSTGCQDAVEYVAAPADPPLAARRAPLDGVVLQAPVSDREGLVDALGRDAYGRVNAAAARLVAEGRGEDALPFALTAPLFKGTPVSARRWLSLASPDKRGADDFFSSDLGDDAVRRTFGAVPKGLRVCALYSGSDEFVPEHVDKAALLERWGVAVKEAGGIWDEEFGGIIEGATHNLKRNGEDVVGDLCRRVIGFLGKVENGEGTHL